MTKMLYGSDDSKKGMNKIGEVFYLSIDKSNVLFYKSSALHCNYSGSPEKGKSFVLGVFYAYYKLNALLQKDAHIMQ